MMSQGKGCKGHVQFENVDLKLDLVWHEILLDLGRSLVSLHQLLVVSSHNLQSHNLTQAYSFTYS